MSPVETKQKYTPTIGIECHVQLKTKTKLFAAVGNDARQAEPNSLISHICVGMPGALPVLNVGAIELAIKAAAALGTRPQKFSHFDRKHYFYPDLPKGYQITQYAQPIIADGHVHIAIDGESKCISIVRAHLEEDAGKNTHPAGADYSLVDLNRAGTPLLEIVSAPDMHSAVEAKAFARELYLLMKYAGVSDVDLYHGNMRFDVNTSVSASDKPGIRTEVKNLNSFRSVEAAVDYEIKRQIEVLERGEQVTQETRGWDEAQQKTIAQRSKEEAEDYRYFPEPDVPPIELDEDYINKITKEVPKLPVTHRKELKGLDVDPNVIEDLLERPEALNKIQEILNLSNDYNAARRLAFILIRTPEDEGYPSAEDLLSLWAKIEGGELSPPQVRQVYDEMRRSKVDPDIAIKKLGIEGQISDEGEIEKIVTKVIAENSKAAEDVKAGEQKAIGFLVGQVMKDSQGKANPALATQIIKKQLGI
jgi:aspartyl-tRNA(Asn)/glutamyl-tRNA(Gln) amidotransferase subunit B